MRSQEPTVRILKMSDVKRQLSPLAADVFRQEVRVIVEESGTPVAALVSVADLERWVRLDQERAERFAVIDRMREAFADVPAEEIEREVDRAVKEVRAEMASERRKRPLAS